MKLGKQLAITGFLSLWMISATAQTYDDSQSSQSSTDQSKDSSDLSAYVQNWAALLGYNVATPPEAAPTASSTQLTSYSAISLTELLLYSSFFGSIPTVTPPNSGGSSSSSSTVVGGTFIPTGSPTANLINSNSNLTFQNFGNANQAGSNITVSSLVDQQPYQSDPTSQALFNILGTPDVSYCTQANGSVANPTNPNSTPASCSTLGTTMFQTQIVENIIGTLPDQNSYYSFSSNQALLAQLNSNSLIAPLMYSTDANTQSTSNTPNGQESAGLSAQNQLQQANNFIRYVSGSVNPMVLPNLSAYQTLYNQASATSTTDPAAQAQAQATLSTYLTNVRVYAAQTSVGLGNLYYILAKRLPQKKQMPAGAEGAGQQGSSNVPSQAFNEYAMATWRIFNPNAVNDSNSNSTQQKQWIDKINNATPATVQKEMAILLSEINYQLYLSRQIQERMLLTNSVSLLQGTKAAQPNADLSNQSTSAPTGASTDNAS